MKLWTVTLLYPQIAHPVRLIFKTEERAKQALNASIGADGTFTLNDEFGVELRLRHAPDVRVLAEVGDELEGQIELSLAQGRAQAKAQKKASADPALNPNSPIIGAGNGQGPVLPFRGR